MSDEAQAGGSSGAGGPGSGKAGGRRGGPTGASGTDGPVDAGGTGGLRRTLSLRDLVVYGLLFIAPMAPVGVFGTLDARSGGAVPLVYVVATVAMAFTAYSYVRMVRAVPQAGSVYAYARAGLGHGAGFVAGWMAMLDYLLIPAVGYLFSGIALNQLVPSVDQWIWTAVAVLVTTALNLSGVRRAASVGFVVLALEIAVLLVFVVAAVVVLVRHGPERGLLSPFTGDSGFSLTALLGAVSVAVLSFLGFDAIANFAEETASSGKGSTGGGRGGSGRSGGAGGGRSGSALVARALAWCLAVAGVLFIAQTYLAELLALDSSAALARHPAAQGAAFYTDVQGGIGGWLRTTVAVSKAVGAAFAALAGQAAAGRLLYAMARDRRLPGALARVDAASGVPRRTVLLSAVITLCAAVWAARTPDGLDRLVSVVNIGALTAFGLLHLSVLGYYGLRHRERRTGRVAVCDLLVPSAGLAVTVSVIVTADRDAHVVGLVWLTAALVILALRRLRGVSGGSGGSSGSAGGGAADRRA